MNAENSQSTTYVCPVCGLHYPKKELADSCRSWCEAHNSCNLDIIKHAVDPNAQKPHDRLRA